MTSILVQSGKLVLQCQTILDFNALRDYGGGGGGANRNTKTCNLQSDRSPSQGPTQQCNINTQFYTGQKPFPTPTQHWQSTEGKLR